MYSLAQMVRNRARRLKAREGFPSMLDVVSITAASPKLSLLPAVKRIKKMKIKATVTFTFNVKQSSVTR